jgi:hypothetical protein
VNKFNTLAAADPAPLSVASPDSAYDARLAALELRLQTLAEENHALHTELRNALSVNSRTASAPTTVALRTPMAHEPSSTRTDCEEGTPAAEPTSPLPHRPVSHNGFSTPNGAAIRTTAHAASVTPSGYTEVIHYLESMQSDLRAQLSALHDTRRRSLSPPQGHSVPAVPVTPSASAHTTDLALEAAAVSAQKLQDQIVSALDTKLGAVQEQMNGFAAMLSTLLQAQSPAQPVHRQRDVYLSTGNGSSSAHSSAFVTPSTGTLGSTHTAQDELAETDPTAGLQPMYLFEQQAGDNHPDVGRSSATLKAPQQVSADVGSSEGGGEFSPALSPGSDASTFSLSASSPARCTFPEVEHGNAETSYVSQEAGLSPQPLFTSPNMSAEDPAIEVGQDVVGNGSVGEESGGQDVFYEGPESPAGGDAVPLQDEPGEAAPECDTSDDRTPSSSAVSVSIEGEGAAPTGFGELGEGGRIVWSPHDRDPEQLMSPARPVPEQPATPGDTEVEAGPVPMTLPVADDYREQWEVRIAEKQGDNHLETEHVHGVPPALPALSSDVDPVESVTRALADLPMDSVSQNRLLRRLLAMEGALSPPASGGTDSSTQEDRDDSTLPALLSAEALSVGRLQRADGARLEEDTSDAAPEASDEGRADELDMIPADQSDGVDSPFVGKGDDDSSSVVDTTDIEAPYTVAEWQRREHSLPASVLELRRHREAQEREQLLEQQRQLEDELAETYAMQHPHLGHSHSYAHQQQRLQLTHPAHAMYHPHLGSRHSGSAHDHCHPPAAAYVDVSVLSAHQQQPEPHHNPMHPQPSPDVPTERVFATSWKFLEQIDRLKAQYDSKEEAQQSLSRHSSRHGGGGETLVRQPVEYRMGGYPAPNGWSSGAAQHSQALTQPHPLPQPVRTRTPPRSTHSPLPHTASTGTLSDRHSTAASVDHVTPHKLVDLTGALNSFLEVIEKCDKMSASAERAVTQLDRSMDNLNSRSLRSLPATPAATERRPERGTSQVSIDLRSLTRSESARKVTVDRTQSAAQLKRTDTFYDAQYVEEYEDSGDEASGAVWSKRGVNATDSGSTAGLTRSRSNSNVFDSTSSIKREPVHTKHFLSPSAKPALPKFTRSHSKQYGFSGETTPLSAASPARSSRNVTASNDYFKPLERQASSNSVGKSTVASQAASRRGEPANSPAPAGRSKTTTKAPLPDVFRSKSPVKNRAYSFASTINTVPSGDSDGGPFAAPSRQSSFQLQRAASRDELSVRSGRSRVVIDGREQDIPVRRSRSKSRDGSVVSGRDAQTLGDNSSRHSRSRSPSRSISPGKERQHSPKEILSQHSNPTAYSFRTENQPRKVF